MLWALRFRIHRESVLILDGVKTGSEGTDPTINQASTEVRQNAQVLGYRSDSPVLSIQAHAWL
jgi:hypothetical protein